MTPVRRSAAILLPLWLLSGHAAAEVLLKRIDWQAAPSAVGVSRRYEPIERWAQAPSLKTSSRPRVLVSLINRGPEPADGAVLRYCVSARLARADKPGPEGVWTVPFFVQERRLPRIQPNQRKEVPIDISPQLEVFLKRTLRSGYWPDALKVQIMVEPRAGEDFGERLLESVVPVAAR